MQYNAMHYISYYNILKNNYFIYHYKWYYIATHITTISTIIYSHNHYNAISFDRSNYPHFPTNFGFTEKLFWVEYSYLAGIKILYQGPFTKIPSIVSLIVFELFQIKCTEGHSPCGGVMG